MKNGDEVSKEQLQKGINVEKEHRQLYLEIKKRLAAMGAEMPITEQEFYTEIAKAHFKERKDYYDLLEKYVEKYKNHKTMQGGGKIPDRYKALGFSRVGQKLKSTNPDKKWMVLAKQGDHYKVVHGGKKGMQDFSQHHDKERRKRFWQRMGGYDSEKTKDSFSPLYWHKKFGTWEEGGEIYSELEEKYSPEKENQLYKQGTIKVAWIGENADTLESKMYDDIETALRESKGKQYLVFELEYSDNDYYRWKLLPYGAYSEYKISETLNKDVNMENLMEEGGDIQNKNNTMKEFYTELCNAQGDVLGCKRIETGTKITDNKTHIEAQIIDVGEGMFILSPIPTITMRSEEPYAISFKELQDAFKKGEVDIEGFEHTEHDERLLYQLLKDHLQLEMIQQMKDGAKVTEGVLATERNFKKGDTVRDKESKREYIVVNPVSKSQGKRSHPVLDAFDSEGNEVILATELLEHSDSQKVPMPRGLAKIKEGKYAGKVVTIVQDLGHVAEVKFYSPEKDEFVGLIVGKQNLTSHYAEGGSTGVSGAGKKFKPGDFVFRRVQDPTVKIPVIIGWWDNGENSYYIQGDTGGFSWAKEENLTKATEKDFDDYYGETAKNYKVYSSGGSMYAEGDSIKKEGYDILIENFGEEKSGEINDFLYENPEYNRPRLDPRKIVSLFENYLEENENQMKEGGKVDVEAVGPWIQSEYNKKQISSVIEVYEDEVGDLFKAAKIHRKPNWSQEKEGEAVWAKVNELYDEVRPGDWYQDLSEKDVKNILWGVVMQYKYKYGGEMKQGGTMQFETGATSTEVNDLLVNDALSLEIVNKRNSIYQQAYNSEWGTDQLYKVFKNAFSYQLERDYNASPYTTRKIHLSDSQRDELARILTDEYTLWKIDNDIELKEGGPVHEGMWINVYDTQGEAKRSAEFLSEKLGQKYKAEPSTHEEGKYDVVLYKPMMRESGAVSGDVIERFIAANNLTGQNAAVKFSGDDTVYYTKNISPDRTHIFVISGAGVVKNRQIKNIVSVDNRAVSVYDFTNLETENKHEEGGRMSEETQPLNSIIDQMRKNIEIYEDEIDKPETPEAKKKVLQDRLNYLTKTVTAYDAAREARRPKPEPAKEISVIAEPTMEEPTQIRTPVGTVETIREANMPVVMNVTPTDDNQYYIILDAATRQKVKDALYYRKIKYSSIVLPDHRTKLIVTGSNNLDEAYAFYEKFKQKLKEEPLKKEEITSIHSQPTSAKARMVMTQPVSAGETMKHGGKFRMCPVGTEIQTLILSKDVFPNAMKGRKWLSEHNFKHTKVDEKENTLRYRQLSPSHFEKDSFRTITITNGVQATIGCPKPDFRKKAKGLKKSKMKNGSKVTAKERIEVDKKAAILNAIASHKEQLTQNISAKERVFHNEKIKELEGQL